MKEERIAAVALRNRNSKWHRRLACANDTCATQMPCATSTCPDAAAPSTIKQGGTQQT